MTLVAISFYKLLRFMLYRKPDKRHGHCGRTLRFGSVAQIHHECQLTNPRRMC